MKGHLKFLVGGEDVLDPLRLLAQLAHTYICIQI